MEKQKRRVLLKLSGEGLAGDAGFSINADCLAATADAIAHAASGDVQLGIVVGGGNFWRGRTGGEMTRQVADDIGMLATIMNALAVSDALEQRGLKSVVLSSQNMPQLCKSYTRETALDYLGQGYIVFFAGGTGNGFFSTDSAAVLRALQIDADIVLKSTMVDGVYDKDPKKHADAKRYERITFSEVLAQNLSVMDATGASLCRDYGMSMLVFDGSKEQNIIDAVNGKAVGTLVKE